MSDTERSALVLFGSETGDAQEVAGEIGRVLQRLRFAVKYVTKASVVIFTVSTTGQGEFPGNAKLFWKRLCNAKLPMGCLSNVVFASFGLGDSSYPQYALLLGESSNFRFNWAHRKLVRRLKHLGATTIVETGESDQQHPEGLDGCVQPWIQSFRQAILQKYPLPEGLKVIADDDFLVPQWTLEFSHGPERGQRESLELREEIEPEIKAIALGDEFVSATLVCNKRLTPLTHWQDVRLFEFATEHIDYRPGDTIIVFPTNFTEDVDRLLDILGWTEFADEPVRFSSSQDTSENQPPIEIGQTTVRHLCTNYFDFNAIPRRSFFAQIAHFTKDHDQKERLVEFTRPDLVDELYDYTSRPRRSIMEVLQEFHTVRIPVKWAATIFPIIRGRKFSIASGGLQKADVAGQGRIQLIVAIVKYRTVIRKIRQGLCTRYLAALTPGAKLNLVYTRGTLKLDHSRPVLLVGPGTGVAPLRALLHERAMQDEHVSGSAVLVYGGRNRDCDFFFESEWEALAQKMPLSVLTAFSRDQTAKIYVQDVIKKEASRIWDVIQTGTVYVCGSSGKMPNSVREALVAVIMSQAGKDRHEAEADFERLKKEGRYQQETW